MRRFVFCHGFGYNKDFWQSFAPVFSEEDCTFLDLGYFSEEKILPNPAIFSQKQISAKQLLCAQEKTLLAQKQPLLQKAPSLQNTHGQAVRNGPFEQLIAVGHSLGFSKLMGMDIPFTHYIGLAAFTDFLGQEALLRRKRQREMRALKATFVQDSAKTLERFYSNCESPDFIKIAPLAHIKRARLLEEFANLEKKYPAPKGRILILSAQDDKVVPSEIVYDNFGKEACVQVQMLPKGGHSLGLWDPSPLRQERAQDLYNRIMVFLNDTPDP